MDQSIKNGGFLNEPFPKPNVAERREKRKVTRNWMLCVWLSPMKILKTLRSRSLFLSEWAVVVLVPVRKKIEAKFSSVWSIYMKIERGMMKVVGTASRKASLWTGLKKKERKKNFPLEGIWTLSSLFLTLPTGSWPPAGIQNRNYPTCYIVPAF